MESAEEEKMAAIETKTSAGEGGVMDVVLEFT